MSIFFVLEKKSCKFSKSVSMTAAEIMVFQTIFLQVDVW